MAPEEAKSGIRAPRTSGDSSLLGSHPPISFRGSPDKQEWYSAIGLIRSVTNQANPRNLAVGWITMVLVGLLLGATSDARFFGLSMAVIGAFLSWRAWTTDSKHWRQSQAHREDQWGTLSDERLDVRLEGTECSMTWQRALRGASNEKALVVETTPGRFVLLARSMFADQEDWDRARALLARRLPKASKLFTNLAPGTSRAMYLLKRGALILVLVLALLLWTWLSR